MLFAVISGYGQRQNTCTVVPQNTCYTIGQSTPLFFNCSCDLTESGISLSWYLIKPPRQYGSEILILTYDIARLPSPGLHSDSVDDYALEDTNLIVKDADYFNAGKYECYWLGASTSERWVAEAIVLGKI